MHGELHADFVLNKHRMPKENLPIGTRHHSMPNVRRDWRRDRPHRTTESTSQGCVPSFCEKNGLKLA